MQRGEDLGSLIASSRHEHRLLAGILDECRNFGFGSERGRERLIRARDMFLSHLSSEDDAFYPMIPSYIGSLPGGKNILERLTELRDITASVFDLFEQLEGDAADVSYTQLFQSLYVAILNRFRKEESLFAYLNSFSIIPRAMLSQQRSLST